MGTEELGVGFGPELAAAAAALPLLNATHSDLADSEILSLLTRTNRATIGTDAYLELCKTLGEIGCRFRLTNWATQLSR